VFAAANRYEAIQEQVKSLAQFASQMLVHYQLDEAEAAELRLRIPDAEQAVGHVREILTSLAKAGNAAVHNPASGTKPSKPNRPSPANKP
jgi:hypothetical protein